jgi:hypothetical protein
MMQRLPGTHSERSNEPITLFQYQNVGLVISLSEWFCMHEENLR